MACLIGDFSRPILTTRDNGVDVKAACRRRSRRKRMHRPSRACWIHTTTRLDSAKTENGKDDRMCALYREVSCTVILVHVWQSLSTLD